MKKNGSNWLYKDDGTVVSSPAYNISPLRQPILWLRYAGIRLLAGKSVTVVMNAKVNFDGFLIQCNQGADKMLIVSNDFMGRHKKAAILFDPSQCYACGTDDGPKAEPGDTLIGPGNYFEQRP